MCSTPARAGHSLIYYDNGDDEYTNLYFYCTLLILLIFHFFLSAPSFIVPYCYYLQTSECEKMGESLHKIRKEYHRKIAAIKKEGEKIRLR